MTDTSRGDRFYRQITEPNPLQRALDDYHVMEQQRDLAMAQAAELHATNGALLAEVGMLKESLDRADGDRIRLQAISSTLLGRLMAINDCIAGAVKASIRDGIEATSEAKPDPTLEQAAGEAQEIIQRIHPLQPPGTGAPVGVVRTPPLVDWRPRT